MHDDPAAAGSKAGGNPYKGCPPTIIAIGTHHRQQRSEFRAGVSSWLVPRPLAVELAVDVLDLGGRNVPQPDSQSRHVDPQFLGERVLIAGRYPHQCLGERCQWDEALCGNDADHSLFDGCESRVAGERAAFEMNDLMGEGTSSGGLAEPSVDEDAAAGDYRTLLAWQGFRARHCRAWVASSELTPRVPSMAIRW
ncbi:hypothetical protein [Nocardia sp. NPDC004711]